jgi:hypothetical protein
MSMRKKSWPLRTEEMTLKQRHERLLDCERQLREIRVLLTEMMAVVHEIEDNNPRDPTKITRLSCRFLVLIAIVDTALEEMREYREHGPQDWWFD